MMDKLKVQTAKDLAVAIEAVRATTPLETKPSDVALSPRQFNDTSIQGVRPKHALDAIKLADDFQLLEYQDVGLFLATRLIQRERPYVILVVGSLVEGKWAVTSAYRLYDETLDELAKNACGAFQFFLLRFGLHFRSEETWALFIPVLIVKPGEAGNLDLIELKDTSSRSGTVVATVRRNSDGTASVAWPFAVDTDKYRSELRSHQS